MTSPPDFSVFNCSQ